MKRSCIFLFLIVPSILWSSAIVSTTDSTTNFKDPDNMASVTAVLDLSGYEYFDIGFYYEGEEPQKVGERLPLELGFDESGRPVASQNIILKYVIKSSKNYEMKIKADDPSAGIAADASYIDWKAVITDEGLDGELVTGETETDDYMDVKIMDHGGTEGYSAGSFNIHLETVGLDADSQRAANLEENLTVTLEAK